MPFGAKRSGPLRRNRESFDFLPFPVRGVGRSRSVVWFLHLHTLVPVCRRLCQIGSRVLTKCHGELCYARHYGNLPTPETLAPGVPPVHPPRAAPWLLRGPRAA